MTDSAPSNTEASRLVRQEMMLAQLRPIEDIVEAARREVARHRAAATAAQQAGTADPAKQREAELAANGIQELLQRFEAMEEEVSGVSKAADAAMEGLHETLDTLLDQIQAAVEKYSSIPQQPRD